MSTFKPSSIISRAVPESLLHLRLHSVCVLLQHCEQAQQVLDRLVAHPVKLSDDAEENCIFPFVRQRLLQKTVITKPPIDCMSLALALEESGAYIEEERQKLIDGDVAQRQTNSKLAGSWY